MAKGLNRIKNLLKNKGVEVQRQSSKIVAECAFVGRNVAIQKAPVAFGKLRQGINIKVSTLKAEVYSQMPYSVYVEFGTGKKVKVPSNTPTQLKKAAELMRGKKSGNFDNFLTSLSRWARLKGIDPKMVYPIAVSILKNGVEPQPFMRPAYIASRKKLLMELRALK